MRYLDFGSVKEEILSPQEFLNLSDAERDNIEWVEPEHKRIRLSTNLGGLKVYYKNPIFKYPGDTGVAKYAR